MKLRQQGIIFLGIPLACELLFLTVFVINLQSIDSAAIKEANAKRIIATCQEIRFRLVRYYMLLGAQRFMDTRNMEARLAEFGSVSSQQISELKTAAAGDQESLRTIDEYAKSLTRISELFEDAAGAYDRSTNRAVLARFLEERDFVEQFFESFQKSAECEEKLIKRYTPVVAEFQPQSLRNRQLLREQLIGLGVINVIVVVSLFLYYRRTTLARLKILMNNMSLFSQGTQQLEAVGGNDELAELDLKFRQMAEARQESERMRRSMYAMVSHDLRSPLTSTSLTLSVLLQGAGAELPEKLARQLGRIIGEVNRLFRLSNTFLDMEKLEDGQLNLDLSKLAASELIGPALAATVGLSEAKKIDVETIIVPSDLLVECDGDRIIQVLVNLLTNAVKFTPARSKITVRAEAVPPDAESRSVRFSVTDQGPGLSIESFSRLFQRYSQLEGTVAGGSGLGLFICKQLVEAHGGKIGAENAPEGGTCFWFELPARVPPGP